MDIFVRMRMATSDAKVPVQQAEGINRKDHNDFSNCGRLRNLSPIHTARARCPPAVVVIDVVAPVKIVVVPVAAMMTTIRASQPDQQACAIAWRPRCKFPWPPDLARLRPWLRPLWPCEDIPRLSVSCPARPVTAPLAQEMAPASLGGS